MLTLKVLVLVVAVVVAVGKAIQMAAASNRFEYPHICMGVGDTLVIGCIWHSSWNWFIWTE
jgi:protein-S-isoprenylcysteine O-methyltransferase Ste14